MFPHATIVEHREVHDQPANFTDLVSFMADLRAGESAGLLCQMNADFRLAKREPKAVANVQQRMAGELLSDETIRRLKERFGNAHMADRPIFHPAQLMNMLRLVLEHCTGTRDPLSDDSARYVLGDACLMMTDLMLSDDERRALKSKDPGRLARTLMVQMAGRFELDNPMPISHVAYRSQIMFHELLAKPNIRERISGQCRGFDFEREFFRTTGVSLSHWVFLLLAFYAYLSHYTGPDGIRHPEYLAIDPVYFGKGTPIPQAELEAVLRSVSSTKDEMRAALKSYGLADWRIDSVPFRSRPLIELWPGKFFCSDLGLLVEKIHSGVFWAIHDGLTMPERYMLSIAWGILFEEYVNWFLNERRFNDFIFFARPEWRDGGECFDGAFLRNSVFMPMEYKGGFLRRDARYSGNQILFEQDLESKFVKGCGQLARNIQKLFNRRPGRKKTLQDYSLDHVTRVVPLLVVQDPILGGPLINWWLNQRFHQLLDKTALRPGIEVDPLTVVGIREMETMAESAEAGTFELFHGVQSRCHADPEMRSNLHNFLLEMPGYGEGKSDRIQSALNEQLGEVTRYLFAG